MTNPKIEIETFNPYESIYPNRKVVTREGLILIKTLRSEGYNVVVKPNDKRPIEYLFKKGEISFLSDPIVQLIISVPSGIIIGLITNWIQKRIEKEKHSTNVVIIDNSTNTIINSFNKKISKGALRDTKKKKKSYAHSIEECLKTKSPYPGSGNCISIKKIRVNMKNVYYIILCLISTLCSTNVNAQMGFYSKSDLSALQELPEKWIKHWNSHNIDSLSSLLQIDADLVTVPGTLLKGKTNFIKDHGPKFLTTFKESVLSKDTVIIRYVKPDMAIIHFGWGIHGDLDRQGNKQDLRHGIGTWVVIKEMNDWKILISHMMLKLSANSTKETK